MQSAPVRFGNAVLDTLSRFEWLGPLLLRLVFGWFWLETGWAKLHNLEFFSQRFVEWGIPFPMLSATASGAVDLVGGALLILGLGTRLIAIPMIVNMLVALAVVVLPLALARWLVRRRSDARAGNEVAHTIDHDQHPPR